MIFGPIISTIFHNSNNDSFVLIFSFFYSIMQLTPVPYQIMSCIHFGTTLLRYVKWYFSSEVGGVVGEKGTQIMLI